MTDEASFNFRFRTTLTFMDDFKLICNLEHVELIVLVSLEAFCHSVHGSGRLLPEVKQCRLVISQDM